MRVKGVSFSTSRRAIVLEQFDGDQFIADLLDEPVGVAMPMVDRVRVDKRIGELVAVLKQAVGVSVEGTNDNRVRVTYEGKSCYLPTKHIGNSMDNEIKRQLRAIGVVMNGDQMPVHGAKVSSWQEETGNKSVPDSIGIIGIQISDTTADLLAATLSSFKNDYQLEVVKKLDQGVNDAMEILSDEPKLKERIAELEHKLAEKQKERDRAVTDLVGQRDEARDRANAAENELNALKASLAGLRTVLGGK